MEMYIITHKDVFIMCVYSISTTLCTLHVIYATLLYCMGFNMIISMNNV